MSDYTFLFNIYINDFTKILWYKFFRKNNITSIFKIILLGHKSKSHLYYKYRPEAKTIIKIIMIFSLEYFL